MHSIFSVTVAEAALPYLLFRLADEFGADMLPGAPGERGIIGVRPVRELVLGKDTPRRALQDFCFDVAGWTPTLGYLSYTLGLEGFGLGTVKPQSLPQGHLKQYAAVLLLTSDGDGRLQAECRTVRTQGPQGLLGRLERVCRESAAGGALPEFTPPLPRGGLRERLRQSLGEAAYVQGVEAVLERIRSGDTYQLNLSTRFSVNLADVAFDPLRLFLHFWRSHPAPFHAWLNSTNAMTGSPVRILSTSPERFLRVRQGEVLAQPIKGTLALPRPASELSPEAIAVRGQLLTESPKEDAELSMIVDLLRNDISRHCAFGSVQVPRHKAIFAVDALLQMYSDVTGRLESGSTCLDLLLDAFPGGSVTGCPKRRTLRIIEALEPHCRDLYCGSVVCIEGPQTMESSIAIRTGWYDEGTGELCFYAGSGIVAGSDPQAEYRETLAKAGKFMRAMER